MSLTKRLITATEADVSIFYLFIFYFLLWVEEFFEAESDAVNCYLLNLD